MPERPASAPEVTVRRAGPDDAADVVALCSRALGWADPARDARLFRWKHEEGPFGPSPTWVAEADGRLVAVRTFLRWDLEGPEGTVLRAVRAVDTATDPDHQGRGLFTRLTTGALPELAGDGISCVFNTPNDQSRPGYLKMGWEVVGRVPVGVALGRPGGLVRAVRARTAAGKWSLPTAAGRPAADVLGDEAAVAELLGRVAPAQGLATRRTPGFLWWRYAAGPVGYRAVVLGDDLREGLALFRLRARGPAREAAVVDVVVPAAPDAAARRRALLARIRREARPDHLLAVQRARWDRPLVQVPALGPLLTWRPLDERPRPALGDLDLRLGDVELF